MKAIYGLVDPRTNAIRYVGKTSTTLAQTLGRHMRDARTPTTAKARWIAKLVADGMKPSITILEASEAWDRDTHNAREIHWIATLGRIPNGPLLNLTDGGDGGNTSNGRKWSQQQRERYAAAIERARTEGRLKPAQIRRVAAGFRPKKYESKQLRLRFSAKRTTPWATACSVCGEPITALRRFTCGSAACRSAALVANRSKPTPCECGYVAKSAAGLAMHRRHQHSQSQGFVQHMRKQEQRRKA